MSTSPYHVRRVEEKTELQGLNIRLENYVLRTKDITDERDRLAAELEAFHQIAAQEKRELQKRYETTIKELRVEVKDTRVSLSKCHDKVTEYERELPGLRLKASELDSVRKERDEYKAMIDPLTEEIKDLKMQIRRLNSQLKDHQKTITTQETTIITLQQNVETLTADLEDAQKQLQSTSTRHLLEMKKLKDSMAANLLSARQEWERGNALKLEKLERDLHEKYEKDLEDLQKHAASLQEQVTRLQRTNEELKAERDRKSAYCTELIARIAEMEEDAKDSDWNDKYRALEVELTEMRKMLFAKEDEFNDLMDIKISLEAEIEHYRRILEVEEERTGNTPSPQVKSRSVVVKESKVTKVTTKKSPAAKKRPARKTKTTKKKGKSTPTSSKRQRTLTRTVTRSTQEDLESGIDLELDLIADTVKITNNTGDDLDISSWVLCSEVGTQNFEFPEEFVLDEGASVTVWSGKGADKKHDPPEHLFWTKRFIWNNAGDSAVLKSADGDVVQKVTGEVLPLDEVEKALDEGNGENCCVM